MPRSRGDPQLRVELAGAVERDHLVAAADMLAIDKDLRDGPAAMRALDHLGPPPRLLIEADLGKIDPLPFQQRTRPRAIGAPPRRVHLDLGHRRPAPKPRASQWATCGASEAISQSVVAAPRSISLGRVCRFRLPPARPSCRLP